MDATVSEIHAYPLRPEGYSEPLFHSFHSRREILEHLARSSWLFRASEALWPTPAPAGQKTTEKGKVIASWREVDRWWEPDGGVDVVWRLLESGAGRQKILAETVCGGPTCRQPAGAA